MSLIGESDITLGGLAPKKNTLEQAVAASERYAPALLALLSIFYAIVVFIQGRGRPLWHDEIFTFDIAHAPTWARLIDEIRNIDLNPPLIYVLTRFSNQLFGNGLLATRLPGIIGFYFGSMCLYMFVKRKTSVLHGVFAVLTLWATPFALNYATEARPYGLILGFFGLVMISWQRAIERHDRMRWLWLLAVGVLGMLMSHVLAVLMLTSLAVAELVRLIQTRKFDIPLWASVCIPLVSIVSYIPLIKRYEAGSYPAAFNASITRGVTFLMETASSDGYIIFPACILALLIAASMQFGAETAFPLNAAESGFIGGLLITPLAINLALRRTHGAYFPRYALVAGLAVPILLAGITKFYSRAARTPAALACIVISLWMLNSAILRPIRHQVTYAKLDQIAPSLPFVTASGLTFLEMDQRENSEFLSRVYYLNDAQLATRYAHATLFEGFPYLKHVFPIRANVTPYREFIKTHPVFLLLGTLGYPEDWLIPCLKDTGAVVEYVGDYPTPYKDKTIFKIRLSEAPGS